MYAQNVKNEALALYCSGLKPKNIITRFGLTYPTLYRWLKGAGISKSSGNYSDAKLRAAADAANYISIVDAAAAHNVPVTALQLYISDRLSKKRKAAKRAGIVLKWKAERDVFAWSVPAIREHYKITPEILAPAFTLLESLGLSLTYVKEEYSVYLHLTADTTNKLRLTFDQGHGMIFDTRATLLTLAPQIRQLKGCK